MAEEQAVIQYQHQFPIYDFDHQYSDSPLDVAERLYELLQQDLTFDGEKTNYATHSLHAFAAKFPPQIPHLFIRQLTNPGEIVLDPMMGSGTALVEATLAGRHGVGVDLDPLARILGRVKSTPVDLSKCVLAGANVLQEARASLPQIIDLGTELDTKLASRYQPKAIEFFHYWFEERTIAELFVLVEAIKQVEPIEIREVLQLVFSAIIITKSGGLTRARDLAHSRPHRDLNKQIKQNAIDVFSSRLKMTITSLESIAGAPGHSTIYEGDARSLPLKDSSAGLIVTSPPYAANAIDYMRAHKFSLIWFGHEPQDLSKLRSEYIGAELRHLNLNFASETANQVLGELQQIDRARAAVVAHYYRDMEQVMREMLRVLMEERAAVLVVGSSIIRGVEIHVPRVLAELAVSVGFTVAGVAVRQIARNSRLLPVSNDTGRTGIEARMHEEGVIGLVKPKQG